TIHPDTVRRVAAQKLAAEPRAGVQALVKATRRGLHQICGAFEQAAGWATTQDRPYEAAYQQLEAAYRAGTKAGIEAACRRALALHSSTRERLSILDQFYARIFEVTGRPDSILDLGCGLNPVALPWMGLAPGSRYAALDIDASSVQFVNRYLQLAGFEPLARWQDILAHPQADPAGVALLLKTSPTLERQEKESTARLVEALPAPFVVVSFAVKSLGGREKGMPAHYRRQFRAMVEGRPWQAIELAFDAELVFVVIK
ncbi:MAG: methyltransferase, partial [Anaerolineae bacterium]|nr:methyltransferase [Anaerolineae bacterium]